MWARVRTTAEEEKEEAQHLLQQAGVEQDRAQRLAGHAQQLQAQMAASPRSPKSPPAPRTKRGLLQLAARLERQARAGGARQACGAAALLWTAALLAHPSPCLPS